MFAQKYDVHTIARSQKLRLQRGSSSAPGALEKRGPYSVGNTMLNGFFSSQPDPPAAKGSVLHRGHQVLKVSRSIQVGNRAGTAHDDTDSPAIFLQSPEPGDQASTSSNVLLVLSEHVAETRSGDRRQYSS